MRDVAANQLGGLVDRVAVPREDATRLQLQDRLSESRYCDTLPPAVAGITTVPPLTTRSPPKRSPDATSKKQM